MNHGDARRAAHRGLKLWSGHAHNSSRFSLKHPPRYLPGRRMMTRIIYHSGDSFMLPESASYEPTVPPPNLAFLLNKCPVSCPLCEISVKGAAPGSALITPGEVMASWRICKDKSLQLSLHICLMKMKMHD